MAEDIDSAGVYFMSVEDFEWRPARPGAEEAAVGKEQEDKTCSTALED